MSAKHRQRVLDQAKRLGLTRAEKSVLAVIADHIRRDEREEWSFPGLDIICEVTGFCRRYVQKVLRRLEEKGVLKTESIAGGWRYRTIYVIPGIYGEIGIITPEPPPGKEKPVAPVVAWEDRLAEDRLRYCRATYNRLPASSPRKKYWGDQIAEIEKEMHHAEGKQSQPAPTISTLVPVEEGDKDSEFLDLEVFYVGLIQMQAQFEKDSPTWNFYQRRIVPTRQRYNEMCQDRDIVAPDQEYASYDAPFIDPELEEQIQAYEQIVKRQRAALRATDPAKYPKKYEERERTYNDGMGILKELQMKRGKMLTT